MTTRNSSHYQDFTNLDQWLYYLENLHSSEIDMGLSRISQVAKRLALDISFAKVITVAGTNGKGTTCAFIENALLSDFVGHSKKKCSGIFFPSH
jgi:dihydrofolate synthase/folylpolyglutamate synthase